MKCKRPFIHSLRYFLAAAALMCAPSLPCRAQKAVPAETSANGPMSAVYNVLTFVKPVTGSNASVSLQIITIPSGSTEQRSDLKTGTTPEEAAKIVYHAADTLHLPVILHGNVLEIGQPPRGSILNIAHTNDFVQVTCVGCQG